MCGSPSRRDQRDLTPGDLIGWERTGARHMHSPLKERKLKIRGERPRRNLSSHQPESAAEKLSFHGGCGVGNGGRGRTDVLSRAPRGLDTFLPSLNGNVRNERSAEIRGSVVLFRASSEPTEAQPVTHCYRRRCKASSPHSLLGRRRNSGPSEPHRTRNPPP